MGIMSDYNVHDVPPRYPRYPSRHRIDDEDENTLYRDDESYMSDAESILSDTSSVFHGKPKMNGSRCLSPVQAGNSDPQKHVFEYWKLSVVPAKQEITCGTNVLGGTIRDWGHCEGEVIKVGVAKNQSEVSEMYQNAVASHEAKSRRSWPVRVIRGKAQSYEQDLEKRCDKLPIEVKDSIKDLLFDRGNFTSTPYRQRAWTVVYMEERYAHRFTRTQGAKVNRHKIQFWKNPKSKKLTEYHIIIRGAETGQAEGRYGYTTPREYSNPWFELDDKERRSRRPFWVNRRRARSVSRPRDRSRHRRIEVDSPSPSDRRPAMRDRSCDSYSSGENYSWRPRDDDDYAPREPEFRSRPRVFGPIPVSNRPAPRHFPPAPTPPESFTPPPGVAQFRTVPRFPPPPPPVDSFEENPFGGPRYPNPFHGAGPCPPYATWNNNQVPPPPPTELPSGGLTNNWIVGSPPPPPPPPPAPPLPRFPPAPQLKSSCLACKSTPDCGHFPGLHCLRPIRYEVYPGTHPDCLACRDIMRPRSQEVFGANRPTAYSFTQCGPIPPWTRPPPPPMCEDVYEDEDNATVLDEDDGDDRSAHSGDGNELKEGKDEDDEDTQVEELFEAPSNEQKEV